MLVNTGVMAALMLGFCVSIFSGVTSAEILPLQFKEFFFADTKISDLNFR